jgi:type I restriction enzyme S subunit
LSKFGITADQYTWITKIISTYRPGAKVYAFGSRARGDHKKYSDLDLAIQTTETIQKKTWLALQEQFSESSIPFKIDLIEMNKIDPDFRKIIQHELQLFCQT